MNNEQHMNVDIPWKAFEEHLLFLRVCGLILASRCLLITLPFIIITVNFRRKKQKCIEAPIDNPKDIMPFFGLTEIVTAIYVYLGQ